MRKFLQRIGPYCADYLPRFLLAGLGMALVAGSTAFIVSLIQPVLDDIFIQKDRQKLIALPVLVITAYLAAGLGRFVQSYQMAFIGEDIVRRIRDRMMGSMIHLDMAFFNRQRSGEMISRITNDISRIRIAVSQYISVSAREFLVALALIGVAVYRSPMLSFFGLVALPLAIYPLARLADRVKRLSHRSQEKDSDITAHLTQIFSNIEVIKSHAAEDLEAEQFRRHNKDFLRINMKGTKARELTNPLMEFIGSIAVSLVVLFGGLQVIKGGLSVGEFFSFATALFMLYTPIKRISATYNKMFDAVAASERIFQIIDAKPTIVDGETPLEKPIRSVELKGVHLSYGDIQALEDISLSLSTGDTVALVGDSGGGKTSLVGLILRLLDASEGEVLVNGEFISAYDLASLRGRIGMVAQQVSIFNDTIAANVAYGSPVDLEKVRSALELAGARGFVDQLENSVDTVLNEFGANLSGGQRQRIAIARALYRDPDVLILDEATSALDNRTEATVHQALAEAIADKITIIIAHRLSTAELADRIVVLEQGRIVGEGSREDLLRDCPAFQRLVERKALAT